MIIDIHTHTFPAHVAERALRSMQQACHTALFTDGTAEGLRAQMTQAGIDRAVVQPVATRPSQPSHINDAVLRTNETAAETGILSFGAAHPADPEWERELERLKEAGVRGIKLHAPYEDVPMDDPRTVALLKKCARLNLIVLIHSGWDVGLPGSDEALPEKTRRALDRVGPMKMIAAHMGGWRCWEEAARLLAETGIYMDTSFSVGELGPAPDGWGWNKEELRMLTMEESADLIRVWGAERVLFGTDSPWADAQEEVGKIQSLALTEKEKAGILGENARKLLGGFP